MVMNRGSSERHGATDIVNLNPRTTEIVPSRQFGNYSDCALFHHLWNEFMRIEQLAANGGKQASLFRLTRVVRDICDYRARIAERSAAGDARDIADGHRLNRYWHHSSYFSGFLLREACRGSMVFARAKMENQSRSDAAIVLPFLGKKVRKDFDPVRHVPGQTHIKTAPILQYGRTRGSAYIAGAKPEP